MCLEKARLIKKFQTISQNVVMTNKTWRREPLLILILIDLNPKAPRYLQPEQLLHNEQFLLDWFHFFSCPQGIRPLPH